MKVMGFGRCSIFCDLKNGEDLDDELPHLGIVLWTRTWKQKRFVS